MMFSREVQTWCDSRGLERWKHRAGHIEVQAQGDTRQSTGWHWEPHGYKKLTYGP